MALHSMSTFEDWKGRQDFQTALLIFLLGLAFLALLRRLFAKTRNSQILLMGASGGGKTTLFHQLRDGSSHQGTVPSMVTNYDIVLLKQKEGKEVMVEVADIPGHPRVRHLAGQYYKTADKILFLVDAVDFMTQKSMLSEHLYEVISDPSLQKRKVPVMIVCNKTDQGSKAHTTDFIRKRLEKEIETVRSTRATLGEGAMQGSSIGKSNEAFTFTALKSPAVSIGSAAALTGDISEIRAFLSRKS